MDEAHACFETEDEDGEAIHPVAGYETALAHLKKAMQPFLKTLPKEAAHTEVIKQLEKGKNIFAKDVSGFEKSLKTEQAKWKKQKRTNGALKKTTERLAAMAEISRDLVKQADLLYKLACRLIDVCEGDLEAKESEHWVNREITQARKAADEARQAVVTQLKQVRYFHKQAVWLTERFPKGVLCDVEGLVKLVGKKELEANDWSLTPGRYVGVAPEEEDGSFDFEEALRDIHIELEGLNAEAVELTEKIKKNFEELGV